jgi:hypothetical protein
MTQGRSRRGGRYLSALALATATFGVVAGLAGATSAAGDPADSGNGSSAAVVTPLLQSGEFGDTVGFPLACSDAGSVISIIGASTSAKTVSPLVDELDAQCSQLSTQGSGRLQQAIAESQSLTLINPLVNPLIAALANGFTTVGTQDASLLAPFGPTVAGLGGTVAFFEGS